MPSLRSSYEGNHTIRLRASLDVFLTGLSYSLQQRQRGTTAFPVEFLLLTSAQMLQTYRRFSQVELKHNTSHFYSVLSHTCIDSFLSHCRNELRVGSNLLPTFNGLRHQLVHRINFTHQTWRKKNLKATKKLTEELGLCRKKRVLKDN